MALSPPPHDPCTTHRPRLDLFAMVKKLDYLRTLQALYDCRKLIAEAQSRGLPTMSTTKEDARCMKLILDMDILDPHSPGSLKLRKDFAATLERIAPERDFRGFSRIEMERVALDFAS